MQQVVETKISANTVTEIQHATRMETSLQCCCLSVSQLFIKSQTDRAG